MSDVVFVLAIFTPHEGDVVCGVYASRESAETARDTADRRPVEGFEEWRIYPIEVGAASRPRWFEDDLAWTDKWGTEPRREMRGGGNG